MSLISSVVIVDAAHSPYPHWGWPPLSMRIRAWLAMLVGGYVVNIVEVQQQQQRHEYRSEGGG